jgi:hypothetical protein
MNDDVSDCRSAEGTIVALIDGIIATSRVVARYLRENDVGVGHDDRDLLNALTDIARDEDVAFVVDNEWAKDTP